MAIQALRSPSRDSFSRAGRDSFSSFDSRLEAASPSRIPRPTLGPATTAAFERYATAARDNGCPRDQFENLVRCGIVLQPTQLRASATARACDVRCPVCEALAAAGLDTQDQCDRCGPTEIGYGGARGGGKSHWLLAQLAEDCLRAPGLKCLLLRKVGKSNRENFEDLRRRVLGGVKNEYKRSEGMLVFPNGSRIVLGHFQNEGDVDAYLGIEYDVIGVEEATTLSSSKYRAIQTCNRTSKPGWRPRMYSTTNPGGVGHAWYKARFIDPARQGKWTGAVFIQATVDDNAFVNAEYRKILGTLTGWQLKAWRYGDWDIAAGQFFTTFRRDFHVMAPFPVPAAWRVWCSLDHGFNHWTMVYLLAEDGDGNVYLVDEHGARGWVPERNAASILAMLSRRGLRTEHLDRFVAGHDVFAKNVSDGGTLKTIADEYAKYGIHLTPANTDRINGAGEFLSRFGDLDASPAIAPRLFIFERCPKLIECIPALQHDPHRPEDVLKVDCDEDGNGGDDPYDGARYGLMEATHGGGWADALRGLSGSSDGQNVSSDRNGRSADPDAAVTSEAADITLW